MKPRVVVTWLAFALATGCAGRSKLEVGAAGGAAGTGGSGAAGAPACAAHLETDPQHCGRCFHSCEGGECLLGECQPITLVSNLERGPTALTIDAEYVWFASPISRVGKDPGNLPESMGVGEGDIFSLAVDGTHLYWLNLSAGGWRMNLETRELEAGPDPGYQVALDDAFFYWTSPTNLVRFPKPGIAGDWAVLVETPTDALALDDTFVYFTVPGAGGLHRIPKTGGAAEILAKDTSSSHLSAWNGTVFVAEQDVPSGIFHVTGPGLRTLVVPVEEPYGVAVDGFGVFWVDWLDGSIWMRSHDPGAEPKKLASGQPFPRNIALDSRAVYWTNDDTQRSVMKLAKP
jgi:hypothetical protein